MTCSERVSKERCDTLEKHVLILERTQNEDSHIITSLVANLTRSRNLMEEVLDRQAWSNKEMARLKSHLRVETERSLQITAERDQAFSQLSAQGSQLTVLHSRLAQVMDQIAELHSPLSHP